MEFKLVSVGELRTHGIGFHVPPSHDTYHAAYAAGNDTTTTNLPFVLHEYDGDNDDAINTANATIDSRATTTMTTTTSLTDYRA